MVLESRARDRSRSSKAVGLRDLAVLVFGSWAAWMLWGPAVGTRPLPLPFALGYSMHVPPAAPRR